MILKSPQPLTHDDRMPWGKHAGERMEDVPSDYLLWCWDQDEFDRKSPVGLYIMRNMAAITESADLE